MHKMNAAGGGGGGGAADGPYSVTCNSQPLTFIDNDFVGGGIGVDNTQASEFNYELTFANEQQHTQAHSQYHHHHHHHHHESQFDDNDASSQATPTGATTATATTTATAAAAALNGEEDAAVSQVVRDLNTLNFEDDEEEMYNVIDLPKHACA